MKRFALILFPILLFTASLLTHQITSAAEKETKAKSQSEAGSETRKADPGKEKAKGGEKEKETSKTDEEAELEKAESLLKDLPASKKTGLKKLLNSGDKSELTELPGIGEATADAIIKARPFESAARLILVKGVGEKTFKDIVKSLK